MKDTNMSNARDLIVDIRGGIPAKCDFCQLEKPPYELHPEEAGMWACIQCIETWVEHGRPGRQTDTTRHEERD